MAKKKEIKREKGRPVKEIDEKLLFKLAQTMLPVSSIAIILDCCVDTLDRRFSGVLRAGRENRRHSLVEAMWHQALFEKDTKMMIWLSKQHLGYKDKIEQEFSKINFNIMIDEIPK
jgi:hypothetical protein